MSSNQPRTAYLQVYACYKLTLHELTKVLPIGVASGQVPIAVGDGSECPGSNHSFKVGNLR